MSNQAYGFKKDSRFAKHNDIADIYNQFLERADQGEEVDDDEEIATVNYEAEMDKASQGHI
jgi:hypothetical protein